MNIGQLTEFKNPERFQEVHRIARSLGAERFATSKAVTEINRQIHRPLPQQESLDLTDDAAEALTAPNEMSSSRRTDQLVTALTAAWDHVGQEPARQDGRGQRRSA